MEVNQIKSPVGSQTSGAHTERPDEAEPLLARWQVRVEEMIRSRPALSLAGCFVFGFMLGMWARR